MTLPGLEATEETPPVGLTDAEVQSTVVQMLDQACQYSESVLSDFRSKATAYYKGMPFGNEVEGRSQFVCSELRDTVAAILPSLSDVFSGCEQPVEFRARKAEDVPAAEQATDYVSYIVNEENPGVLTRYTAFKDAMVRRLGIVKYWWEPGQPTTTEATLTGVSQEQLTLLDNDPSIESGQVSGTNPQPDGSVLYDVVVRRRINPAGRVLIEAVPPEEFVFSPNAKSLTDALCVAHITRLRRSDLVRMGYSEIEIDAAGTAGRTRGPEYDARQPQGVVQEDDSSDNPEIDYAEVYCYLDTDGDAVAENRRVVILGQSKVVDNKPFDGRPFALYSTDPEPHSIVPMSVADGTMDLQLLKSAIVRGMLDSAAQTIHPGQEVVEGQVNMTDIMNTEVGRVVRVRAPGMRQDIVTPFVGKEMFPVLMYADEMKENRFGISKAAAGLAPDALQSSTKAAVAATVTASQQHLKLMARMLAEGEKQLYRGVLRLVVQHQDRAKTVRLRNEYVEVDPRYWDADMDCVVNVGLGAGTSEERRIALQEIAAHQGEILKLLGPTNPLVTLGQYSATLSKLVELLGFKDTTRFWKPIPLNYEPPPAEPKPTPEEIYAQVEQMKLQADVGYKQAQLELERGKTLLEEERLRDGMEIDAYLKAAELAGKLGVETDKAEVQRVLGEQRLRGEQVGAKGRIGSGGNGRKKESPVTGIVVLERDANGRPLQYHIQREGQ